MKNFVALSENDRKEMLDVLSCNSIEDLFSQIPVKMGELGLGKPLSELQTQKTVKKLASKNNIDYIPSQSTFVPINDLLIKYNNSKLSDNKDRIYEYGFKGETIINTETGLIDIIKFTLVKNGNF